MPKREPIYQYADLLLKVVTEDVHDDTLIRAYGTVLQTGHPKIVLCGARNDQVKTSCRIAAFCGAVEIGWSIGRSRKVTTRPGQRQRVSFLRNNQHRVG